MKQNKADFMAVRRALLYFMAGIVLISKRKFIFGPRM
jgi:hypothetical protein